MACLKVRENLFEINPCVKLSLLMSRKAFLRNLFFPLSLSVIFLSEWGEWGIKNWAGKSPERLDDIFDQWEKGKKWWFSVKCSAEWARFRCTELECTWWPLIASSPDCTWTWLHLNLITPNCTWLHLIAPDLTWWHLITPGGTWLHLIAPGGTWLHLNLIASHWFQHRLHLVVMHLITSTRAIFSEIDCFW